MNTKLPLLFLSGKVLIGSGCADEGDRDSTTTSSTIAPADSDKSSQPASKTDAPDTGLGHISDHGQNDPGGKMDGLHNWLPR